MVEGVTASRFVIVLLTAVLGTQASMVSAGAAAPTLSLVWIATTGSTSGGVFHVVPGDTLTLQISVHGDSAGLTAASVSLAWDAGDLVASQAVECPSPPNPFGPGICTPDAAPALPTASSMAPGVTISPGAASAFDAGSTPPAAFPGGTSMILGQIAFTVAGSATVETVYATDVSIIDGNGASHSPQCTASLTAEGAFSCGVIPEPGTAGLLALGLFLLAAGRSRRG